MQRSIRTHQRSDHVFLHQRHERIGGYGRYDNAHFAYFDGISDVAIGLIMDKVHSKHGRGRAWVLWMALPYGISAVALFCLPANATAAVQAIYIFHHL